MHKRGTKTYLVYGVRVLVLGGALSTMAAAVPAQDIASATKTVTLSVPSGRPIRLIMTEKLPFKMNHAVRARVTEPVYVFDREVVSQGAEVSGRIIGFRRPSRWIRAYSLMSGNLTPLRTPQIEFDKLVLKDGTSLSISTDVTPGTDNVVRFSDAKTHSKGKVATAKDLARQQIEARKRAIIDAVKAPGKMDRLKGMMWSMLPYHPQSMAAGTRFTATLRSPLDFGTATLEPSELDQTGSQAPASDVVNAVIDTALDSHSAQHGMAVQASLSRPVFSADHHLIFPEGSRLIGTVVQGQAARHWHRSGKLAFVFTQIEAPEASPAGAVQSRQVEGRLESVGVDAAAGDVRVDEEGGVTVAESKKRFIAPAVAALFAARSTEGKDTEPDNDSDDVGGTMRSAGNGNNFGPRIIAGGFGFGLLGAALGRLSQPLSSALGFYGVGRLAYSNIIGRGQEITFPKNTPVEIRFDSQGDHKPE